ncbi:MAG: GNAT family N-acetyltransferase [Rubrivivax sp. SCN 71-131]|jgi:predicted GNAT family acetyltransferase|nr:MAG: GNAT family N-acetyltransferase [Rubrivivax sp. SCN 71-131]
MTAAADGVPAIVHRPEASRFEAAYDEGLAVCVYRREGDLVLITHTEVPVMLEGRGIAAALVQATLGWARAQGLRVRPLCSYVVAYMRRHPQTQDLLG